MSRRLIGRVHRLELTTRTVDLRAMSDEQLMEHAVRAALRCNAELVARALSPGSGATDAMDNPIDIRRALEEQNGEHIRRVIEYLRKRDLTQDVIRILRQAIGVSVQYPADCKAS
ncbi:MAG: hypothetical protein AAFU49_09600 [Pseudomonadota bacterium]